jgi:hypothetical protein
LLLLETSMNLTSGYCQLARTSHQAAAACNAEIYSMYSTNSG